MTETVKVDSNSLITNAKKILSNPVEFYKDMPRTGGYINPLIFTLVMSVIGGLLTAILSFVGISSASGLIAGVASLMAVIVMPIFVVIASFIGGLVLHIIWKLLGTEQSYETSYRCLAYASAIIPIIVLLSIIPYLDTLVRVVWVTLLVIVASSVVHHIQGNKAKIVFGVLAALMLFMGLSSQYASRSMEDWSEEFDEKFEKMGDMTAEEADKTTGDFLKELEKNLQGKTR